MMATVSQRPNTSICRSSGVVNVCTSCSIALMRPISVASAVATTTPVPWPYTTSVLEYAMQ